MQVTSTTSSGTSATGATSAASSSSSSALSETQFLQLLTEQLENQDPLQPMDDSQFLAQMAQFTALQETDTTNQQISRLTASSYIGATVTVNTGTSQPVVGQVTGVDTSGTDPQVYVNGTEYPIADIKLIGTSTAQAAPTTASTSTSTSAPTATAQSNAVSNAASAVSQAASGVSNAVTSIKALVSP